MKPPSGDGFNPGKRLLRCDAIVMILTRTARHFQVSLGGVADLLPQAFRFGPAKPPSVKKTPSRVSVIFAISPRGGDCHLHDHSGRRRTYFAWRGPLVGAGQVGPKHHGTRQAHAHSRTARVVALRVSSYRHRRLPVYLHHQFVPSLGGALVARHPPVRRRGPCCNLHSPGHLLPPVIPLSFRGQCGVPVARGCCSADGETPKAVVTNRG